MFYHLKIVSKEQKNIVLLDLTKEELMVDYVKKYLNGNTIIVDGFLLKPPEIKQFKIVESQMTSKQIVNTIRQDSLNYGIVTIMSERDIVDNGEYVKDVTNQILNLKENSEVSKDKRELSFSESKNVFIVHGRDRLLLTEVENFIRKIGLVPVVLFKEPDKGLTIIEKIENYSLTACYAIALYTKCDEGYAFGCEIEKKPRARQNVVFEHGYLMALLGRKRVGAIVLDGVEKPSDIDGIVYVPYDERGAWMIHVARNMKEVGIDVDLNKVF